MLVLVVAGYPSVFVNEDVRIAIGEVGATSYREGEMRWELTKVVDVDSSS